MLGIELEGHAGAPLRDVDHPPGQAAGEIEPGAAQLDLLAEHRRQRRLQPGAAERQIADPAAPGRAPEHHERLEPALVTRVESFLGGSAAWPIARVACRRAHVMPRPEDVLIRDYQQVLVKTGLTLLSTAHPLGHPR